jgi:hypothetical protein
MIVTNTAPPIFGVQRQLLQHRIGVQIDGVQSAIQDVFWNGFAPYSRNLECRWSFATLLECELQLFPDEVAQDRSLLLGRFTSLREKFV